MATVIEIEYQKPKPIGIGRAAIEAYAEDIVKRSKKKPSDTLPPLVKALGGRIRTQSLSEWELEFDGSIVVDGPGDFEIVFGGFCGPARNNFTIAHELGHYFLHSRQGEIRIKAARKGTGIVEQEANCFAAALLMPRKQFEAQYNETPSAKTLAALFCVSEIAAEVRIKSLGLK